MLFSSDDLGTVVDRPFDLVLEPVVWALGRNWKPLGHKGQADDNLRPVIETAVDDFAYLIAADQPLPPARWLTKGGARG